MCAAKQLRKINNEKQVTVGNNKLNIQRGDDVVDRVSLFNVCELRINNNWANLEYFITGRQHSLPYIS